MKQTIYVPDIECESCSRLIEKRFGKLEGLHSFKVHAEKVDVEYDPSQIEPGKLVEIIKDSGFRASFLPFEKKTFSERIREYKEKPENYALEVNSLKYSLIIFLVLSAIGLVAFIGLLPGLLVRYGWWLFYLNITVASIASAVWHFYSYKGKVTCMTGMMVGMTIGMQAGMMLGAVIGATNGFFVGAMAGMIAGVAVGAITGSCCGVMGWMQGMMAGLMGGTMGPMISVMMLTDNLLIFMPFYMAINVFILWGFSYMVYEEIAEGKKVEKKPLDFLTLLSISILVAALFVILMAYGPKSALLRW